MQNVYTQVVIADTASNAYKTFLHELLKADGASLWHCSAGKDRAGFATILVLYLLDFDLETIINDYLGTNHYYTPKVEKMIDYYGVEYTDTLWSVFGVEREYLDVLFKVDCTRADALQADGAHLAIFLAALQKGEKIQELRYRR